MSEKMCGDRDRREELTPEKAGAGYGRLLWEELKGLLESAGAALAGCGDLRGQAYSVGVAVALPVPDPIIRQLLEGQGDKLEIVVTFLAVLELMKLGKLHLSQEETFGDMDIETLEPEGEEEELDLEGLDDFEG